MRTGGFPRANLLGEKGGAGFYPSHAEIWGFWERAPIGFVAIAAMDAVMGGDGALKLRERKALKQRLRVCRTPVSKTGRGQAQRRMSPGALY
ncbi:MAG: hypothetical protein CM15mP74_00010 [Halieaceae bacterium]|nr:MAG: hypothetical protein CM15mP74_00010 [Halieaceae bacterium]